MTEEESLQRAVTEAETEVQTLETEVQVLTAQRRALSAQKLSELEARTAELSGALSSLATEERSLNSELQKLEQQLQRPGFRLPPVVATPWTWFLRSCAFFIYAGSLVGSYRYINSPGVVLALVLGLPVAFVFVMMAGSLRESGAENAPGERAGQGEEPARVVAGDERAGSAPGGSAEPRAAEPRAEGTRDGAGGSN